MVRQSTRRQALRSGTALAAVGVAGCLGGGGLPTATPAGDDGAIDVFVRNDFVVNDDDGNKVNAEGTYKVTRVLPSGDIELVAENSFSVSAQSTKMFADEFTVGDDADEYVITVETNPVLRSTRGDDAQYRFEPGSEQEPTGVVTLEITNGPFNQGNASQNLEIVVS